MSLMGRWSFAVLLPMQASEALILCVVVQFAGIWVLKYLFHWRLIYAIEVDFVDKITLVELIPNRIIGLRCTDTPANGSITAAVDS